MSLCLAERFLNYAGTVAAEVPEEEEVRDLWGRHLLKSFRTDHYSLMFFSDHSCVFLDTTRKTRIIEPEISEFFFVLARYYLEHPTAELDHLIKVEAGAREVFESSLQVVIGAMKIGALSGWSSGEMK